MTPKHLPRPALVALVLLVVVGAYYVVRAITAAENGALRASGTIEAVVVDVSPELAGQTSEVLVQEGESVKAGARLLIQDGLLLEQQRAVAAASVASARAASNTALDALNVAQANYQQTLEQALLEGRQSRLKDWFAQDQIQFDQPDWYFSRAEQIGAVQAEVDLAMDSWMRAQQELESVSHDLGQADFLAAEERLLAARIAYQVAKDVNERAQNSTDSDAPQGRFNKMHCGTNEGYLLQNRKLTNLVYRCTGDEHLSDVSESSFDASETELDAAQRAYDDLLSSTAADQVLRARAQVAVTHERYYAALDRLSALQTGDFSPAVTAAQGIVDQAEAAYEQSQSAVAQAQANLDLVDAQIEKLTLVAPLTGVVLSRNVEPGEYLQPGAAAISIADLNQLTITVYIPEDRYGQVSRGQSAVVTVDSYPGVMFEAKVTHIADQAEFTPRNVQTVEGRSATVFAIELAVVDGEGRLKPGMPADVVFGD